MSKIPTPTETAQTPQQIDATLRSAIAATQTLIYQDPRHLASLRPTFLQFFSHPTFQLVLGIPSQNTPLPPAPIDNQLKAELAELKSNISALSKAVNSLQPKVKGMQIPAAQASPPKSTQSAQGKGPSPHPPPTFANVAAAKARASLVFDVGTTSSEQKFDSGLTADLNNMLQDSGYEDVKLSASRYTKKGNLVLMAHQHVMQSQLNAATPTIHTLVLQVYKAAEIDTTNIQLPPARANVKWSKILINSVPVGTREQPHTPEECHRSLVAHNPAYASLKVTQKPSWVRPPFTL